MINQSIDDIIARSERETDSGNWMVAWEPNYDLGPAPWRVGPRAAPGEIEVGEYPDRTGWSRRYRMWVPFNFPSEIDGPEMMVFLEFAKLVVHYGIDPAAAHREFLKIDAYRQRMLPDDDDDDDDDDEDEVKMTYHV